MTERAVLAVSFGTSHRDTLEKNIAAIEAELAAAFPERTVRRAFTSGMILRKLAGEGTHIDNVPQALERLLAEGCTDVVVQPTHVMNGEEYHKLLAQAEPYRARFARMSFGRPLLTAAEDYAALGRALMEALLAKAQEAGYKTLILWTAGPLEAAIRQYERFGFRVVETSENRTWRPDGEPVVEIKMEKKLKA